MAYPMAYPTFCKHPIFLALHFFTEQTQRFTCTTSTSRYYLFTVTKLKKFSTRKNTPSPLVQYIEEP